MANVPEVSQFDAGIYQIETADPVLGGVNGIANAQAKALANRTKFLYDQQQLKAPLASPAFTGNPTVPTPAADDNDQSIANTAYVQAEIATERYGRLLNVQTLNSSATYTPTPGMKTVIVEVQAGGGGGGGAAVTGAGQVAAAYGGTAGAFGRGLFTAAQVGASQAVTVGQAGTGGTAGANAGGAGGTSSFGSLLSAPGGAGGAGGTANAAGNSLVPDSAQSSAPTGANLLAVRGHGSTSFFVLSTGQALSGGGGASFSGPGAPSVSGTTGIAATSPGAGGGGAALGQSSGTSVGGGAGGAGYVTIYEYA